MKFKHRYIGTPMIYFLLFIFAAIAFTLSGYVVRGTFDFLCNEFPRVFRSANFITNPDGYERQTRIITVCTAFLALLGVNYLSLLFDNKRMEHIAKATEGRYTLAEGMRFYYRSFAVSDIITAIIPPALIAIPVYFVPTAWLDYGLRFPMLTSLEVCSAFDFWRGTVLVILTSLVTRFLIAPIALLRWRAAWLSGTAEVL